MIEKYLLRKYGQQVTARLYRAFIVVILVANGVVPLLVSRDGFLAFLIVELVVFVYLIFGIIKKRIRSRMA